MLIMTGKYGFVNLMVGFLLMSIYVFSSLNSAYNKVLFALILFTEALDLAWLIMNYKVTAK